MEESGSFNIDTKGICLLCLKDCNLYNYAYVGLSQTRVKKEIGSCTRSISFKMLLRYLKINLFQLCNFPPAFLESMDAGEDADIVISLCVDCSMLTGAFSRLYESMEEIRLQLDACVKTVFEVMKDGGSMKERVEEYQRRRRSKSMLEMMTANVAEQLRNETMRRCSLKVDALIPRVTMYKREPESWKQPDTTSRLWKDDNRSLSDLLMKPQPKSERYPDSPTNLYNRLLQDQQLPVPVATKKSRSRRRRKVPDYNEDNNLIEISEVVSAEELVVKVEPMITSMSQEFDNEEDPLGEVEGGMIMASEGGGMGSNDSNDMTANATTSNSIGAIAMYPCSECSRSYAKPSLLLKHQLLFHNQKKKRKGSPMLKGKRRRLRCKFCPKLFVSQFKLQIHMKSHPQHALQHHGQSPVKKAKKRNHGVGRGNGRPCQPNNATINCQYCDKGFSSRSVYQTHLVAIHCIEVYKNSLPEGTTEQQLNNVIKAAFAEHIRHPREESKKQYGCPFNCDSRYPHPSHLRLHIIRNHFQVLADRVFEGHGLTDETQEGGNGYDEMSGEGYEIELENGNMDIDDEESSMFHREYSNGHEDEDVGNAEEAGSVITDVIDVGEQFVVLGEVGNQNSGDLEDGDDDDDQPPILMRETYSLSDINNLIEQNGDSEEVIDSIPIVQNEEVF